MIKNWVTCTVRYKEPRTSNINCFMIQPPNDNVPIVSIPENIRNRYALQRKFSSKTV